MKMRYEIGTKFYKMSNSLGLDCYEFKGMRGNKYECIKNGDRPCSLSFSVIDNMNVSRRMVLVEIEEHLKIRLKETQRALKLMQQQFNPLDTSRKREFKGMGSTVQVHKYDKITGEYIESFESIKQANESLGKGKSGLISLCCRGSRPTALGYRWHYEKMKILKPYKKKEYEF